MINPTDYNLITFKAITTFISQLNEIFGSDKQNFSLKLYNRLISKTTISHDKAIQKHIDIFKDFCTTNRDGLLNKDIKKIITHKIIYSDKVYIDFSNIFKRADKETTSVIWKHLLTISALVDPAGNAKEILKNSPDNIEADFLTDIINKVETHVSPGANPMEAINSIMSSGVFTELISGMNSGIQDGKLDLGKLMGTVQKMCVSIGVDNKESSTAMSGDGMDMISNLLANMNSDPNTPVDPSQLLNMFGPMLTTLNNKADITEETTE